jgi:hypothetical protein
MKPPPVFLLLVATRVLADPTVVNLAKPVLSPSLKHQIEQEYSYLPRNSEEKIAASTLPISGELVSLPPFKVEEISWRKLTRAIAEEQDRKLGHAFTLKGGGTILKNVGKNVTTELKFQFHREIMSHPIGSPGFDILSFSR